MKIHTEQQGSPEWLALRSKFFTASEAPAMMGVSKYQTRSELLKQKATGIAPDVDAATQRLFDNGHATEALARVIVERQIGDDLFPIVASSGNLLASVDGATMLGDVLFEHKAFNASLAECVKAGELPAAYYWQLEQQLLVTGAEKVIFVCSDGTEERFVQMEYRAVPGRAEQLIAGWKQFEQDLAEYQHKPEAAPAPTGTAPDSLPALRIEVTGMVTASNLDAFKANALAVFQSINTDLQTDQHFADAEKTVKWCGDVEERLAAAKQHALSQTESIDALFRAIDDIAAEARGKRLELDKLIKARKTAIRDEIVTHAINAMTLHVEQINATLGGKIRLPHVAADFAGAIKGKKSISSLRDAADTELARAKIEASGIADRMRANLETLLSLGADREFLFADAQTLVMKDSDDLTAIIKTRIAEHEQKEAARMEQETARIRAEELAKIERAQAQEAARLEREARAEAQRAFDEDLRFVERQQAETVEREQAVAAVQPSNVVEMPAEQPKPTARRPSDDEIIEVLAMHYRVHESKVIEWIITMDMESASRRMMEAM